MPAGTPPLTPSAIAARLRAAGCVFAEDETRLIMAAAGTPARLAALVDERAGGLPLEYVLGWAEFAGLRIAVDRGVFVPRRRTEFLLQQAVAVASGTGTGIVAVDMCCGSGAVGAALAAALGQAEVHATDIEPAAVACARRNLAPAGGQVYQGDLYEPLPARLRGRVAIITANTPYVPSDEVGLLPSEAREHEPRVALDGGPDGLAVLRRVIAGAPAWLARGGQLVAEVSERQLPQALTAAAGRGLIPRAVTSVDLGAAVVIAAMPTV